MTGGPLVGILAAAGAGERLGRAGPKALVPCGGRALFQWSLEPLAAACERVLVALPPGERVDATLLAGAEPVEGGRHRSESVLRSVRAAPEAATYVVHDAARPLVTRELIEACVAALDPDWDAAVAAAPMTDTVKETDPDGKVLRTHDRTRLWAVQTPQAFTSGALRRALEEADPARLATATDDASLVEESGGRVRVVEASPENLKVTRAGDLERAADLLAARG